VRTKRSASESTNTTVKKLDPDEPFLLGKFIDSSELEEDIEEEIEVELNELFGGDDSKLLISRQTNTFNNVTSDTFVVVNDALNVTSDDDFVAQIPSLEETYFFPESIITGRTDFGENGIGLAH